MVGSALAIPQPAEAPVLLEVQGLARSFGARVALNGLSFRVHEGEIFGLLGPNGAGKSTSFQILAGLIRPDAGIIQYQGLALSLDDPRLRTQLGVVFQRPSLDDQLSARENLMLGARLYGLGRAEAEARTDEMLGLCELSDRADEKVKGWSGGMRRRLELSRALVHRPRVLLMDEPTQGLDEASFRRFWEHLRSLRQRQGLTVLLTTHRPEEAESCDRLLILDQGKEVACASPSALAAQLGGDVITLAAADPQAVAAVLEKKLSVRAKVVEGKVQVEQRDGHLLVPRLVEAFAPGTLSSVSLRKPTLADVFLKLTGRTLGADVPTISAVATRGAKR